MQRLALSATLLLSSSMLLLACGGSAPEPAAPPSDESAESTGATGSAAPASSSEPAPEPEAPKGPDPRDVLLKDEASFVYNFGSSDEGKKQEEKCDTSAGDDPQKKSKCMSAALKKVPREGFSFEQEESGDVYYIRFGIVKNQRVVYNKVKAELGEPSGAKITISTSGPDKAARRKGKAPAQIEIEVVDEYTVVINDPDKGRTVYDTRLGLFAESEK